MEFMIVVVREYMIVVGGRVRVMWKRKRGKKRGYVGFLS